MILVNNLKLKYGQKIAKVEFEASKRLMRELQRIVRESGPSNQIIYCNEIENHIKNNTNTF